VLVQALGLGLANAPARIRRLGYWSRRLASPLLRPHHRHSLTRGRPASSSYATWSIPEATSRNSRVGKVGQAGSSIRPGTACSSAFQAATPRVPARSSAAWGCYVSAPGPARVPTRLCARSCSDKVVESCTEGEGFPTATSAVWIPDNNRNTPDVASASPGPISGCREVKVIGSQNLGRGGALLSVCRFSSEVGNSQSFWAGRSLDLVISHSLWSLAAASDSARRKLRLLSVVESVDRPLDREVQVRFIDAAGLPASKPSARKGRLTACAPGCPEAEAPRLVMRAVTCGSAVQPVAVSAKPARTEAGKGLVGQRPGCRHPPIRRWAGR
jgi:hypothetical protein